MKDTGQKRVRKSKRERSEEKLSKKDRAKGSKIAKHGGRTYHNDLDDDFDYFK